MRIFSAFGTSIACLAPTIKAQAAGELFTANSPSVLEEGEALVSLNHAFGTKLREDNKIAKDLNQKGFGFKTANAGLAASYRVWHGLELSAHSSSRFSEYAAGAAYTLEAPFASIMAGAQGFVISENNMFQKSTYSFLSASTHALEMEHFVPSVGIGYDSYNKFFAVVAGLVLPFSEKHSVLAEYHVRVNPEKRNTDIGEVNSWSAGYQFATGGHHFALLVSNTAAITERQANLGTADNNPNWAFRITRSF